MYVHNGITYVNNTIGIFRAERKMRGKKEQEKKVKGLIWERIDK